jgi:hypothetical protein
MPVISKERRKMFIPSVGKEIDINWRTVESSNVTAVGWDKHGNMYVLFNSGSMYAYLDVPYQRAVWAAYYASTGSYINSRIKSSFACVKL